MSTATANQLLAQLGGGHITAYFLVLARIAPLFWIAPLFSSKMVPRKVRTVIAIALAIGLTPVASHGLKVPTEPLEVLALLIQGMLVGTAFAFAIAAVFAALSHAGAITDAIAGFGFAGLVDPVNGNTAGVLTQVYSLVGMVIFIVIGGDAWMLRGISRTFDLVPLTSGPNLNALVAGASQTFGSIFVGAIEVAAPALLALLITDTAFGMVSRVVPQLNVFAVGFPVKVGVALLVVGATLPFLAGWLNDTLVSSVGTALHSVRIG